MTTTPPINASDDPLRATPIDASNRAHATSHPPTYASPLSDDDAFVRPIKLFMSMIWKWKLLIIALPILFSVLGMLYSLSVKKTWRAEAKLQLKSGSVNFNPFDPYSVPYYDHLRWLETQKLILTTDHVLATVYDNVKTFDDFASVAPGEMLSRDETIDAIRRALRVELIRDTDIMTISYVSGNRKNAAAILNAVVTAYVDFQYMSQEDLEEKKYLQAKAFEEKLLRQRQDLMDERARYIRDNNIQYAGELRDRVLSLQTRQMDLLRSVDQLERQKIEFGQNVSDLANLPVNQKIGLVQKMLPYVRLDLIRNDVVNRSGEYEALKTQLSESHPDVLRALSRLRDAEAKQTVYYEEIIEQTLASQKNQYDQTIAQLELMKSNLASVETTLKELAPHYEMINLLEDKIKSKTNDLESNRTEMLRLTPGVNRNKDRIAVVENPKEPLYPYSPRIARTVILTGFFGAIFAVAFAYLLEFLNTSIRNREDLLEATGVFPLGVVPYHPSLSLNYLNGDALDLTSSQSSVLECYQIIWTGVKSMLANRKTGWALTISSAAPEEGKSISVLNIGYNIARNGGRVLIIDADMRKPSIGRRMGITSQYGLDSCLKRLVPREKAVVQSLVPNLHIMIAGEGNDRPTDLLTSSALDSLIVWAKDIYDVILIDTPPMLTFADAMIIAQKTDGLIFVVHGGKTDKKLVARSRMLALGAGVNIIGGIINDRSGKLSIEDRGDYNYYSYYYKR